MEYDSSLAESAYKLAERWDSSRSVEVTQLQFTEDDLEHFSSTQKRFDLDDDSLEYLLIIIQSSSSSACNRTNLSPQATLNTSLPYTKYPTRTMQKSDTASINFPLPILRLQQPRNTLYKQQIGLQVVGLVWLLVG